MKQRWLLWANGTLMAIPLAVLLAGAENPSKQVLPERLRGANLAELEGSVALQGEPRAVAQLAAAYLERRQPGLAQAMLERYSNVQDPAVELARARTDLALGHATRALSRSESVVAVCERASASSTQNCPSWVYGKALRLAGFVKEVVRSGIEDPARDPAGTEVAFQRSHGVRLLAAN